MRYEANDKPSSKALALPWLTCGQTAAVFFLMFAVYTWFRVEPPVEYQHSAPVFLLTRSFLAQFLECPGGLLNYAAAFLSQLNYYGWLGAMVYTAVGVLLFLGARELIRRTSGLDSPGIPFVIPFLLLITRGQYDCPALAMSLGLLAATALALCYFRMPVSQRTSQPEPNSTQQKREAERSPNPRNSWMGVWLPLGAAWILSVLLFYVAGAWPSMLFGVLIGLFEGLHRRPKLLGLLCAVPILIGSLWLVWFHDSGTLDLLNPWGKGGLPLLLGASLYLFLPLTCALLAVRRPATTGPASMQRQGLVKRGFRSRWFETKAARQAFSAGLFVVGWLVVWFGFAAHRRMIAEIDYYASRGDYEKVLSVAAGLTRQQMDASSEARLHLALYRTGRLGEEVFSYRNQSGWDVLPALGGGLDSCRAQSRTLLELGLVSEAEHLAHEALETEGERPELLRRLAQINVLKDRPKAARVFLNVLHQIPFQQEWAGTWLRNLQRDPRFTDNTELAAIRPLMATNDLAHQAFPAEGLLVQLLHCNPTNQMAFEYLMAEYLMNLEVNKLVDRLWQLDNFRYAGIPRHYEEALLLYEQTRGSRVELRGRSVRTETVERFRRFTEAMNQRIFKTDEGRQALARDFGDTFWYYYFGRRSESHQS